MPCLHDQSLPFDTLRSQLSFQEQQALFASDIHQKPAFYPSSQPLREKQPYYQRTMKFSLLLLLPLALSVSAGVVGRDGQYGYESKACPTVTKTETEIETETATVTKTNTVTNTVTTTEKVTATVTTCEKQHEYPTPTYYAS